MATHRWQGEAPDVVDVWTLTPGGTIEAGSTFTVTMNGKTLVYTATGTTVASVTAGVTALWNSTDDPPPPEFRELVATDDETHVTLRGIIAGRPHTLAASAGGSGSPTFGESNTTPATGRNHIDNALNLSGGVALANGDTLILDSGDVPILYGLTTTLTTLTILIKPGYSGSIGLPEFNNDGDAYAEYRPRYLVTAGATLIEIDSPNVQRVNIDHGSSAAVIRVLNSGQRIDPNIPAVLLKGSNAGNTADVNRGDVGLAFLGGETASYPVLRMSFVDNRDNDAIVTCGTGCSLTTIEKAGGSLVVQSNVTALTQGQLGGETRIEAGAVTTINANGGTIVYNSEGTLGTLHVANDAFIDFDQDGRNKTITNSIETYGSAWRIRDTKGVALRGGKAIKLNRNSAIGQIEGPTNFSVGFTAI